MAKWIRSQVEKVAKCNYDQICLLSGQVNGQMQKAAKWKKSASAIMTYFVFEVAKLINGKL